MLAQQHSTLSVVSPNPIRMSAASEKGNRGHMNEKKDASHTFLDLSHLDDVLKDLDREDASLERELHSLYGEALLVLGMRDQSKQQQQQLQVQKNNSDENNLNKSSTVSNVGDTPRSVSGRNYNTSKEQQHCHQKPDFSRNLISAVLQGEIGPASYNNNESRLNNHSTTSSSNGNSANQKELDNFVQRAQGTLTQSQQQGSQGRLRGSGNSRSNSRVGSRHGSRSGSRGGTPRHNGSGTPRSQQGTPRHTSGGDLNNDSSLKNIHGHHSNQSNPLGFDTQSITDLITAISSTEDAANQLCTRVRELDVTKTRIHGVLTLVTELLAIRESADVVGKALSSRDYELAAKSVARYKQAQQCIKEQCLEEERELDELVKQLKKQEVDREKKERYLSNQNQQNLSLTDESGTVAANMEVEGTTTVQTATTSTIIDPRTISTPSFEELGLDAHNAELLLRSRDPNSPGALTLLLDPSILKKLEEARREVARMVSQEFESAIKSRDRDAVSRFARLFFPLGLESSAVATYVTFCRDDIRDQASQQIQRIRKGKVQTLGQQQQQNLILPYKEVLWDGLFTTVSDLLMSNKENLSTEFGPDNFVLFLRGIYSEVSIQQTNILKLFREQEYQKYLNMVQQNQFGGNNNSNSSNSNLNQNLDINNFPRDQIRRCLRDMQRLCRCVEYFTAFLKNVVFDAHCAIKDEQRKNLNTNEGGTGSGQGGQGHKAKRLSSTAIGNGEEESNVAQSSSSKSGANNDEDDENIDHNRRQSSSSSSQQYPRLSDKEVESLYTSITGGDESGGPNVNNAAASDLVSHYVTLQRALLHNECKQALLHDQIDLEDAEANCSSMVDELFYVLKDALSMAIETCNHLSLCCILNEVAGVLSITSNGITVYRTVEKCLRESLPPYRAFVANVQNIMNHNDNQSSNSDSDDNQTHPLHLLYKELLLQGGEKKKYITAADSWPVAVNNCFRIADYIDHLIKGLRTDLATKTDPESGELLFPEESMTSSEKMMLEQCLSGLQSTKQDYLNLASNVIINTMSSGGNNQQSSADTHGQHHQPQPGELPGVPRNTVAVLKMHLLPALRPFENTSLNLSELQFQDFQVNDLFIHSFIRAVWLLICHLKGCYLPEAVEAILDVLIDQTCNRLSANLLQRGPRSVSLFGGLQVDQDIRQLQSFFLERCGDYSLIPVRRKFRRLSQISGLLTLERAEEVYDSYSQSDRWELKLKEVKRVLMLRFSTEEVEDACKFLT